MKHISIMSLLMYLLALLFGISCAGCGHTGNGNIKVERRNVGSFHSLVIEQQNGGPSNFVFAEGDGSGFKIKLIKDTVEYTTVEYDENLIHHVKTESVNDRLIIRTRKNLFSKRDIRINVHYINLDNIDASVWADITFATPYHGKKLDINISGAGQVSGEVFADVLEMDLSGGSYLNLGGKSRRVSGNFTGSGNYKGFGLISDTCILDISGAADAQVHVLKYLKVGVSGAGNVEYMGSPKVDRDISGAGSVHQSGVDSDSSDTGEI